MLAEIYGKISSSASNLNEKSEDELTGNVFGSLRYLPASTVLVPFLNRAYYLSQGKIDRLAIEGVKDDKATVELWVHDYPNIEPDVRIKLRDKDGNETVILIEVKFFSGLSSEDSDGTIVQSVSESRNQLLRQINVLRQKYPQVRKIEIYLTKDIAFPSNTLEPVGQRLRSEGIGDVELYWLSWHDITQVLDNARKKEKDTYRVRILNDLLALCKGKKAFEKFKGLEIPTPKPQLHISFLNILGKMSRLQTSPWRYEVLEVVPKNNVTKGNEWFYQVFSLMEKMHSVKTWSFIKEKKEKNL